MPYSPAIKSPKRLAPDTGDPAPDATLTDVDGNKVTLSSIWTQKPVVLVFLRHFGCPFCREQVAILKAGYSQLEAAGAETVCVGQGTAKVGKAFSIYYDLPYPVLVCEDDFSVYGRYGLTKGTFAQMMGVGVFLRGLAAIKHGIGFGKTEGDPLQMPGVFIVDTLGTVIYAHRALNQADNISVDILLTVLNEDKSLAAKESNV